MHSLVWSIKKMRICLNLVKPSVNAVLHLVEPSVNAALNRLNTIPFPNCIDH